jgi:hypothetical protein
MGDDYSWVDRPVIHVQDFGGTMDDAKIAADSKATEILNTLSQVVEIRWNFQVDEGDGMGHYKERDVVNIFD